MKPANAAADRLPVIVALAVIAAAALVVLHPVLRGGFLVVSFDDDAFILDNPYIRALTWENVWACATRFYHRDYLPLPMLSYLLEFQLWGTFPAGYHLTNLLLHAGNALLVYAVSRRALAAPVAALFAGLIFAVHPVQLESVAVVAQRKTLLATGFLLAALFAYQMYSAGRRRWYVPAVILYLCAGAAKSSVVPFPFLLLLYDYSFQPARLRLRDKLPFLVVAGLTLWLSVASKAGTEVIKGAQGGSYVATALVMSRVMWEYVTAMLLPFNLSPSYYYSPRDVFSLTNCLAAAALLCAAGAVVAWRRRFPLTFFSSGWVVLSLLPVANIVPIAVLRADRYLYLPMVGFAVWGGWGLTHLAAASRPAGVRLRFGYALPAVAVVLLGVLSWRYAAVWSDDVTAWTRVVERHPWNARAHYLLAVAYADRDALETARRLVLTSMRIDPDFARPRALLVDIDRRLADRGAAALQAGQPVGGMSAHAAQAGGGE